MPIQTKAIVTDSSIRIQWAGGGKKGIVTASFTLPMKLSEVNALKDRARSEVIGAAAKALGVPSDTIWLIGDLSN